MLTEYQQWIEQEFFDAVDGDIDLLSLPEVYNYVETLKERFNKTSDFCRWQEFRDDAENLLDTSEIIDMVGEEATIDLGRHCKNAYIQAFVDLIKEEFDDIEEYREDAA